MKFSFASILALATVAIAAPTNSHEGEKCNYMVCTDDELLAIDLEVNVLGILGIELDIDVLHHHDCKRVYCCPDRCEVGEHVPDTCYRHL